LGSTRSCFGGSDATVFWLTNKNANAHKAQQIVNIDDLFFSVPLCSKSCKDMTQIEELIEKALLVAFGLMLLGIALKVLFF
jgi:hypothetical protein